MENYKICYKIDEGAFGNIYLVKDVRYGGYFAMKFETVNNNNNHFLSELQSFRKLAGGDGIPIIYDMFQEEDNYILVMELLGFSLAKIFKLRGNRFSLKNVIIIADQLLHRIEFIHSKSVLHLDIKPGNILVGLGDNRHKFYLIDYGLSRRFREEESQRHIPYKEGITFTGSLTTASVWTHLGVESSRRDDLESLGYTLILFVKGSLPWQKCEGTRSEVIEKVCDCKIETTPEDLCRGLPDEFLVFMKYVRRLGFSETPDYLFLRQLFADLFYTLDANERVDKVSEISVKESENIVRKVTKIHAKTY